MPNHHVRSPTHSRGAYTLQTGLNRGSVVERFQTMIMIRDVRFTTLTMNAADDRRGFRFSFL